MTNRPLPVQRYLDHVLAGSCGVVRRMEMEQTGVLRTDPRSPKWYPFSASHVAEPATRRFHWDASVRIMPGFRLRVTDEYAGGVGTGRVRMFSALTVALASNRPELDAASLHRFLAEAVWYPTALQPGPGLHWTPVDQHQARATLRDRDNEVDLTFRFNDAGEVTAIHTSGRWRREGGRFELTPWEGHFSDYRLHQGLSVPFHGEVGWFVDGRLEIVWKGDVNALSYEFEESL